MAVYSGNCALDEQGHPVCIYSGGKATPCDTGVCAYSTDWVHWNKTGCMQRAPSPESQTNHDTAIFRIGALWHLLVGGCTYRGGNLPAAGERCEGNAQVWTSGDNLRTFEYSHPLTPGGPSAYWELPYLLPFDSGGGALPNDAFATASQANLTTGRPCV